jgi:hypothetical protein
MLTLVSIQTHTKTKHRRVGTEGDSVGMHEVAPGSWVDMWKTTEYVHLGERVAHITPPALWTKPRHYRIYFWETNSN